MKKLIFPATNRVHLARQMPLLEKLKEHLDVHICMYGDKGDMSMSEIAVDMTQKFQKAIETIKPDIALIRGDRFELLPIAMLCAYSDIPIAHIEAGDLSGVIDNKVRFAISHLSDIHFATNDESYLRLHNMGFDNVKNVGSLDIEFAMSVKPFTGPRKPSIVVLWHPVPNEPFEPIQEALNIFRDEFDIIGIKGNKDYGTGSGYKEEYNPEEFIQTLGEATVLVGNSSAGIKEASILGTPVVNIGSRQKNRLTPANVISIPHGGNIIDAIQKQIKHGKYSQQLDYFKPNTSDNIAREVINFTNNLK